MVLHEEWEYFVGMTGWSIVLCYTRTVCWSQIIYFTQNKLGLAVNQWRVTQVHERSWVTAHEPRFMSRELLA